MIIRKLTDKKPNILVFQGSPRKENSCANQDSKTQKLVDFIYNEWAPFANIDVIDLSVGETIIQPCKGCISTSNGFHCHWKCVAEDQRVHTKNGFKQIKDLVIGDVLQDGNRVVNHVKTSDSEEVFELKLKDGRKIELTRDHKVKVLSRDRRRDIHSNWKFYRTEEWVEVQNIKIDDIIPTIQLDHAFIKQNDVNLDYLSFGLIWGDGTFANDTALLYVDKKEEEFIQEINRSLNNYIISNLPHKINDYKPIMDNYKIYNPEMIKLNFGAKFGRLMKSSGFTKTKAKERRLPLESFGGDSNKIFSFLNGWISTDGSVGKKGITIYNTSYDCLRDLQLLLSRVGIRSSISDTRHLEIMIRGNKTHRCSSLSINGYDSVKIVFDNINLINPKKQKKLEEYISSKKNKMVNKPTKVKSIKSVGYKPVYDIEVENSHEFNCEGINIHNCSCYGPNSKKKPDLMYDAQIYEKLEMCDAFLVVSPIHWYSVSTQVKAMFDRLVCANQTITKEEAIQIMGKGNIKNSKITGKTELSGKYKGMLKNHLKGKTAAFFVHGDDGANDYDGNQPNTGDQMWDVRNCVMPLVYQCRYSEINCPDELVEAVYVNKGIDYYRANMLDNDILIEKINDLFERLLINLNSL